MRLHNANFSPDALRVRAVAFELGIDLDIVEVDIRKGDNRAEGFLRRNPDAKPPDLEDGDFMLWESRAICSCLASRKPAAGLVPSDHGSRAVPGDKGRHRFGPSEVRSFHPCGGRPIDHPAYRRQPGQGGRRASNRPRNHPRRICTDSRGRG